MSRVTHMLTEICKIIGSSGVRLDTLLLDTRDLGFDPHKLHEIVFESLIDRSPSATSKVESLEISTRLLRLPKRTTQLIQSCNDIKSLEFDNLGYCLTLENLDEIIQLVADLPKLTRLTLSNWSHQSTFVKMIQALGTFGRKLECLEFKYCSFIPSQRLYSLARCTNLMTLRFTECAAMSEETFRPLASASLPHLRVFEYNDHVSATILLSGQYASNDRSIVKLIANACTTLEHVRLRDFDTRNYRGIFDSLSKCQNLRSLELPIECADDIRMLVSIIPSWPKLGKLYISKPKRFWGTMPFCIGEILPTMGVCLPPSLKSFSFMPNCEYLPEDLATFLGGLRCSPLRLEFKCPKAAMEYYNELHLYAIQRNTKILDGGWDDKRDRRYAYVVLK